MLLREHLKKDSEGSEPYEVHGSARLPGSKYTIGEIEINECETKAQLEALVAAEKVNGHSGGGCCGLCKSVSILDNWSFKVDAAAIQTQLNKSLEQYLGPEPAV